MNLAIVPIVLLSGIALLYLGRRLISQGKAAFTRRNVNYQLASAGIALTTLGGSWLVSTRDPVHWLTPGTMDAPVSGMDFVGVTATDNWSTVGVTFLVVMSVVTAVVLWRQVGRSAGFTITSAIRVLPLVLALSLVNAAVEELIFRVSLVNALDGVVPGWGIAIASALVFGIPHYFGKPGGPVGILMAGFMGWFSTMSIVQTGGIGWAYLIHVVQDIIILTLVFVGERNAPKA